jgi:hypothetical protein
VFEGTKPWMSRWDEMGLTLMQQHPFVLISCVGVLTACNAKTKICCKSSKR